MRVITRRSQIVPSAKESNLDNVNAPALVAGKLIAYLQLVRLPNISTAVADVLAGYLVATGGRFFTSELAWLLVSSSCIYAAGCALNDLCDREVDAKERPFRPIPSGQVSPAGALLVSLALFGFGLVSAFQAGKTAPLVACFLVVAVAAYDLHSKNKAFAGPFNMALCRALNLVLGLSAAVDFTWLFGLLAFVSFLYVFSLTLVSRFETGGKPGWEASAAMGSYGLAAGILFILVVRGTLGAAGLFFLALLVLCTGPLLWRALLSPGPDNSGRAVKVMIICLPLLDAVYSSGLLGWAYGMPVVLLIIPSVCLARSLYVT